MRLIALSLRLAIFISVVAISLLYAGEKSERKLIRFQAPRPLSFQELVTAATVDPLPPDVQRKLDTLLSEPFISNEATLRGAKPKKPEAGRLGLVLRIAEWNINRGENQREITLALANAAKFEAAARATGKVGRKKRRRIHDELRALQSADVIVLDEVDDGVKRTDYRNVTRDLAQALDMNYAYGVEFIELNGIYLGAKQLDTVDLPREQRESEVFEVNPHRYLGLEGSAILSRYPIQSARIIRLPQAYDWYHGEIKAISDLERVRRWSAETLFQERIHRQVRRGGRMALVVNLEMPESPTGTLTIVCPHLENYSRSSGRREQMDALLEDIRANPNPVVVAGDFNTTGHDGTPVTIKRE